jgi:hypothetical protein
MLKWLKTMFASAPKTIEEPEEETTTVFEPLPPKIIVMPDLSFKFVPRMRQLQPRPQPKPCR